MFKSVSNYLVAATLTFAVIGGAAAYFTYSLAPKPVHYLVDGVVTEHPVQTAHTASGTGTVTELGRAS